MTDNQMLNLEISPGRNKDVEKLHYIFVFEFPFSTPRFEIPIHGGLRSASQEKQTHDLPIKTRCFKCDTGLQVRKTLH